MQTEVWKPVPDWDGLYEVSSLGRVRSIDRAIECRDGVTRTFRGILRRTALDDGGYPNLVLSKNGHFTRHRVHCLVAAAFLGPRPEGMVIRHLDGNAENCHVTNLAYGSVAENVRDTIRHGRHKNFSRTRCTWGHLLSGMNVRALSKSKPHQRYCVACSRANSALRSRKDPAFQVVADRYYADLMKPVEVAA